MYLLLIKGLGVIGLLLNFSPAGFDELKIIFLGIFYNYKIYFFYICGKSTFS